MGKNRLEAFSDGVLAIIITIMVLELKVPHGDTAAALQALLPVFLSYVLSFGCRSAHLSPAGWEKTISLHYRRRSMASFC